MIKATTKTQLPGETVDIIYGSVLIEFLLDQSLRDNVVTSREISA